MRLMASPAESPLGAASRPSTSGAPPNLAEHHPAPLCSLAGDGRWHHQAEDLHLRRHVLHQLLPHGELPQTRGPGVPVHREVSAAGRGPPRQPVHAHPCRWAGGVSQDHTPWARKGSAAEGRPLPGGHPLEEGEGQGPGGHSATGRGPFAVAPLGTPPTVPQGGFSKPPFQVRTLRSREGERITKSHTARIARDRR